MTRITQRFYRTSEIKMLLLVVKQIVAPIPHTNKYPFGQCITPFIGEVWKGSAKHIPSDKILRLRIRTVNIFSVHKHFGLQHQVPVYVGSDVSA